MRGRCIADPSSPCHSSRHRDRGSFPGVPAPAPGRTVPAQSGPTSPPRRNLPLRVHGAIIKCPGKGGKPPAATLPPLVRKHHLNLGTVLELCSASSRMRPGRTRESHGPFSPRRESSEAEIPHPLTARGGQERPRITSGFYISTARDRRAMQKRKKIARSPGVRREELSSAGRVSALDSKINGKGSRFVELE